VVYIIGEIPAPGANVMYAVHAFLHPHVNILELGAVFQHEHVDARIAQYTSFLV
jgi:hypothetical protein